MCRHQGGTLIVELTCSLFTIELMEECMKTTWMRNIDSGMPFVTTTATIDGNSGGTGSDVDWGVTAADVDSTIGDVNGDSESRPYLTLKMVR